MRLPALIAAASLMVGCSALYDTKNPDAFVAEVAKIKKLGPEELTYLSEESVCHAMYSLSTGPDAKFDPDFADRLLDEYKRREIMTWDELQRISERNYQIGDNFCTYIAMFGIPHPNRGGIYTQQSAEGEVKSVEYHVPVDELYRNAYFVNGKLVRVTGNLER